MANDGNGAGPHRSRLLSAKTANVSRCPVGLPDAQPSEVTVRIGQLSYDTDGRVISAEIENGLDLAVDISNLFLEELNAVVPPGVVVPAKSEVLLLFERRPTTKDDGFAVFVTTED